ncbi:MAG: response regulator [Thermodesulfobacteriota bacterium]|nr:response regulator [Thermodesulfobacteriota bacterium]
MAKKILIVDDEIEQIDFASTILEETGHTLITAMDGREGMNKAKAEKPDLILMDIMMPEQGGIGMYQNLKHDDETKNIPVIIVTGITRGGGFDDVLVRQDQDIPAPEGYIEKPMNPETVLKMVNDLLP